MKTKFYSNPVKQRGRTRRLRVETLCQRRLLASDMMNAVNPLDVNNDYRITASDALVVVNYMNKMQLAEGESASAAGGMFPDTNGDGQVGAGDALRVINRLAAEGEIDLSNGDMSVKANGHDVIIKFSGNNVTLNVSTPSPNTLLLEAVEIGSQTVPIDDDFIVDVSGNNLRLNIDEAVIPDDLIIEMSGSNNRFTIEDSIVGDDLLFEGGNGNDFVSIGPNTVIDDLLKLRVKKGNDSVSVNGARIGDDFLFYGDDGNDSLSAVNVNVGDDAIIRMGDDIDELFVRNTSVHDVADADGGDSHLDALAIDAATVAARRLRHRRFEIFRDFDNGNSDNGDSVE